MLYVGCICGNLLYLEHLNYTTRWKNLRKIIIIKKKKKNKTICKYKNENKNKNLKNDIGEENKKNGP